MVDTAGVVERCGETCPVDGRRCEQDAGHGGAHRSGVVEWADYGRQLS